MPAVVAWERYWTSACFVCGRDNQAGLRASVVGGQAGAWLVVDVPSIFNGMPGILHGGIVASLLDEAMWYAAFGQGLVTVTASLEVRFVRPVAPGEPLLAMATPRGPAGPGASRLRLTARLFDARGSLLAAARGSFSCAERVREVHRLIQRGPVAPDLADRIRQWPGIPTPHP